MTRGELRQLVLQWLDDPNAGYFTPEIVNGWLNNGLVEVQKKLIQSGELYYAITVQTNTVANIEAYTLPTDYMRLHRIDLILSGTWPNDTRNRLSPVTPVQASFSPNGTGTPRWYWLKKDCIVLVKPPDQAYALEMIYSPQVAAMTLDSETPDCPDRYVEFIALHACKDGFLRDQRDPNPIFKDKWDYYEKLLVEDAQNRNVDEPREVVVTDDSGYY